MSFTPAFVAGIVAGLGVAMPLGAIGLLLLDEGVRNGWRLARAAAAAVAAVDLLYASIAVIVGAKVADAFEGHERTIRVVGGFALLALVAWGIANLIRGRRGEERLRAPAASGRATAGRFAFLTLANPLTLVYFAALAAGLADHLVGGGARLAFVIGVGLSSLSWQLVLAAMGSTAGRVLGARGRILLSATGLSVVLVLALLLLLR
jgi:threonine/homoserine/homoserine lactone efflux protein